MREILFRGKRADNGEWVYGYFYEDIGSFIKERASSVSTNTHLVDPSTVGQYTGLTDKNGRRIFEGDVVEYREYGNLAVAWDDGAFQLEREYTFYDMLDHYTTVFSVVIGNIHDNQELLEEVSVNA